MSKIALILTQGFADWEYAFIAGLGGPFYGLDVQFFTTQPGEIRSQGGLVSFVRQNLDDLVQWSPQAIVIVGGLIWASNDAPDIGDFLTKEHEKGTVLAGICGGTLALARTGLLNRVKHTSNDREFLKEHAKGYSGEEFFIQSPSAVRDSSIITAPGTAPVSFTAAVFESVGMEKNTVLEFKKMMSIEHGV